MNRDMDWDDLKAFLAVMRAGRLTAAARAMRIDHSTLSRRIHRLEEALQTRLFDRLTGGYRPTAAGEQLLQEAEAVESLTIGMQSRLGDGASQLAGAVRIAGPEGFGTYFLAPRFGQFTADHPAIEIELIAKPGVVSLSRREAEMAVTNICPQKGPLHASKLTDYELGVYASAAYLSRHPEIRQPRDLAGHDFIGYIEDMLPTAAHDYLQEVGKSITPRVRISNILTQLGAAAGGVGLCVLPCFICASQPDLVRLLPTEIRIIRSYWLVIHSDLRQLPRVRAAAAFIADAVRAERDLFLPGQAS
jgi:DNA-binding transcriptional LysR family regulator